MSMKQLGTMRKNFSDGFKAALNNYHMELETRKRINEIQSDYTCCGSEGVQDWFGHIQVGVVFN